MFKLAKEDKKTGRILREEVIPLVEHICQLSEVVNDRDISLLLQAHALDILIKLEEIIKLKGFDHNLC